MRGRELCRCVHQVESEHAVRLAFRIAQALPLYAGAGQRTLLAHAPHEVVQAVFDGEFQLVTMATFDAGRSGGASDHAMTGDRSFLQMGSGLPRMPGSSSAL